MSETLSLKSIEVPFNGKSIILTGASWLENGSSSFTVRLNQTGERAEVSFIDDVGIRILDELDLAGWWLKSNRAELSNSWLFFVSSGGWFDFESNVGGLAKN